MDILTDPMVWVLAYLSTNGVLAGRAWYDDTTLRKHLGLEQIPFHVCVCAWLFLSFTLLPLYVAFWARRKW